MISAFGRLDGHHGTRVEVYRERARRFDLILYREQDGNRTIYTIDILMRLQFRFYPGSGGTWTPPQERQFMRAFERVVSNTWTIADLLPRTGTRQVFLRPVFDMSTTPMPDEHWRVGVLKREPDDPVRRWNQTGPGAPATPDAPEATSVLLLNQSANDLHRYANGSGYPSSHEYGHMLNYWREEYEETGPAGEDHASVMNNGNAVRTRHIARFRTWAEARIREAEAREERARAEARRVLRDTEEMRRSLGRTPPTARDAYRHLDRR